MTTQRLRDLLINARSKNAGPFMVTMDFFCRDQAAYESVTGGSVLTPASVAAAFKMSADDVRVFNFEPALAIKVSMPREVVAGAPGDRDIFGGQQFAPLLELAVDG